MSKVIGNKKFEVISFNTMGVKVHNFISSNIDCYICHCNLNTNSLYYQDKGIDSYVTQGLCGHLFHNECINIWIGIGKNKKCPNCSNDWIYISNQDSKLVDNKNT